MLVLTTTNRANHGAINVQTFTGPQAKAAAKSTAHSLLPLTSYNGFALVAGRLVREQGATLQTIQVIR